MKKNLLYFLVGSVVLAAVSVFFYLPETVAKRRVFSFPLIGTEAPVVEIRYIRTPPEQDDIQAYVSELLLGPATSRARPLFSRETRMLFCFLREKTLYVNLSKDALFPPADAADVTDGVAFLKKNIMRNFRGIKQVTLFVDGNAAEFPIE